MGAGLPSYGGRVEGEALQKMTRYDTPEKRQKSRDASLKWKKKNTAKTKALNKAWDKKNPDKKRAYSTAKHKRWKLTRPAEFWYNKTKHRATRSGLKFDLTVGFLAKLFESGRCSVTGIPFNHDPIGSSRTSPWAPSVDQIVAGKGYTKKNVRVVCWIYNLAKHEWDDETVGIMVKAMKRKKQ